MYALLNDGWDITVVARRIEQAQALITEGMGEERVERFLKDISGLVSLIRSK